MRHHISRGFTLLEAIIAFAIMSIILAVVGGGLINTPGKTEEQATAAADQFIATNSISVKRKTCAHDSDGDGQASCTLVTNEGEKIFLSCPTGILKTTLGATNCKEVSEMAHIRLQRQ